MDEVNWEECSLFKFLHKDEITWSEVNDIVPKDRDLALCYKVNDVIKRSCKIKTLATKYPNGIFMPGDFSSDIYTTKECKADEPELFIEGLTYDMNSHVSYISDHILNHYGHYTYTEYINLVKTFTKDIHEDADKNIKEWTKQKLRMLYGKDVKGFVVKEVYTVNCTGLAIGVDPLEGTHLVDGDQYRLTNGQIVTIIVHMDRPCGYPLHDITIVPRSTKDVSIGDILLQVQS